jgi:hypothetical protein
LALVSLNKNNQCKFCQRKLFAWLATHLRIHSRFASLARSLSLSMEASPVMNNAPAALHTQALTHIVWVIVRAHVDAGIAGALPIIQPRDSSRFLGTTILQPIPLAAFLGHLRVATSNNVPAAVDATCWLNGNIVVTPGANDGGLLGDGERNPVSLLNWFISALRDSATSQTGKFDAKKFMARVAPAFAACVPADRFVFPQGLIDLLREAELCVSGAERVAVINASASLRILTYLFILMPKELALLLDKLRHDCLADAGATATKAYFAYSANMRLQPPVCALLQDPPPQETNVIAALAPDDDITKEIDGAVSAWAEAEETKSDPYPCEFDTLWKWAGYTTKHHAKRALLDQLKEADDYVIKGVRTWLYCLFFEVGVVLFDARWWLFDLMIHHKMNFTTCEIIVISVNIAK